jgi:two-component system phosphate regulon sensor histidine kinase PhoR
MKLHSLSALIAFWASVVTFVMLIASDYFLSLSISIYLYIAIALAELTIVFFVVRYWLQKELYAKIRTIYKNIYNFKIDKTELKRKVNFQQLGIKEIGVEVNQWMKDEEKRIDYILALEKYRKEYIGNVSHELKTPIFTIQGYVSTLLDGAMQDEQLTKKYLERTDASIDRIITIINDLDTITQLELGEINLKYIDFDLVGLIKEVVESLELKAKEREITIQIVNDSPVHVNADNERISQVLVNLIDNAIKYSNPQGVVRIKFFDMDDQYLIEVADKGIGISEKDLPRIFERFFRTDKARSRLYGGSGLGLSIVKHIIEAHNQTINVRSKFGEGTVFGFTLKKTS